MKELEKRPLRQEPHSIGTTEDQCKSNTIQQRWTQRGLSNGHSPIQGHCTQTTDPDPTAESEGDSITVNNMQEADPNKQQKDEDSLQQEGSIRQRGTPSKRLRGLIERIEQQHSQSRGRETPKLTKRNHQQKWVQLVDGGKMVPPTQRETKFPIQRETKSPTMNKTDKMESHQWMWTHKWMEQQHCQSRGRQTPN